MKKLHLLLIILLVSLPAMGQTPIETIKQAENTKTGNYKDLITGFLQLATTDFTGDTKTIDFNATLFALRTKANPALLEDYRSFNQRFARNLQFNTKLNFDSDFKFEGFTGGLTYAIINGRDVATAEFAGSELHQQYDRFTNELNAVAPSLIRQFNVNDFNAAIKKMLNKETDFTPDEQKVVDAIEAALSTTMFQDDIVMKDGTKVSDATGLMVQLNKLRDDYYEGLGSKALWTISADGSADTDGKFNRASISTVFLQGIDDSKEEIDIRLNFNYADTTAISMPRTALNFKAGINFIIKKDVENISYFEVKANGEYNKVFKNVLPGEEEEHLFANAEVRIRIADDLWIPITIKYDIENANVLGFLNLTYNFGGFPN